MNFFDVLRAAWRDYWPEILSFGLAAVLALAAIILWLL